MSKPTPTHENPRYVNQDVEQAEKYVEAAIQCLSRAQAATGNDADRLWIVIDHRLRELGRVIHSLRSAKRLSSPDSGPLITPDGMPYL